jgi:hypothetical protein
LKPSGAVSRRIRVAVPGYSSPGEKVREKLTSKLTKQRESHANWTDLGGENLRNVEIHRRVTECSLLRSVHVSSRYIITDSPLKRQVKVNEQDTKGISNPVGRAGKLGGHGSKARRGDDDPDKTSHVHASTRVDLVMEPCTQGVVDQTCFESVVETNWLA